MIELKKTKQGGYVLLSDLEKNAVQMKDSLDSMAQEKISLEGVRVYGCTIVGKSWRTIVGVYLDPAELAVTLRTFVFVGRTCFPPP